MKDYKNLIEALRHCNGQSFLTCRECQYNNDMVSCTYRMLRDAADAIEALRKYNSENRNEIQQFIRSNKSLVEEIDRLKHSNEELREKQTYIDRYGAEWLISAKDVPNYAYEHGYADGMAEVKAQLPKHGEWKATEMYMTDECTACGFLMNWEDVPECLFNLPHFKDICPNCGAKMGV